MKLLKIQEGRLWEGSIRETFFMWIHRKRDAPGGGGEGTGSSLLLARTADMDQLASF